MLNNIQKLREMTGAGVMDCKKALNDSKGELDKALELIKERGLLKAAKREGRETGAGLLEAYIHNGRVGVLLELRCETDFVAHSDPFKEVAKEIVMQIAAMNPEGADILLKQPFIKDEKTTVEELIKGVSAKTGENIKIGRFTRFEI